MHSKDLVITDRLPAYFLFDYAMLGSFALTTKDTRYILDEYAVDYKGEIDTPGHHFSTVLKNVSFPKQSPYSDNLTYPYKAVRTKHPYCFYIDIRHAFSQITRIFGLDCSHREGGHMAFGTTPLPDIFEDSKIMRALLVGGTYPKSTLQEWKNHELTSRTFPNRNNAPYLRRAIFGMLHAIGSGLSEWTYYHHTDGFIVPYGYVNRVFKYLDERGVVYSIKAEGVTEIYGVGSYRVGNVHTNTRDRQGQEKEYIRRDCRDWWLKQWDRGRAYRG